ncbi:unnamed protein product [Owenia fusiformis]|uniref:Forkhead box protein N3 n=1 Tax=Owenia fusiformis TaxID=6347 RepID=A0A8J1Y676_OWEFU|nr:unnamed protein product [Owenia fusiformis]
MVVMAPMQTAVQCDESDQSMRQRLVHSLSASFPGSALSKALSCMEITDEGEVIEDPLSSSCFAEIRLEKLDSDDDDLTSLDWLKSGDLLKDLRAGEELETSDETQKENGEIKLENGGYATSAHPPNIPYNPQKHVNSKPPYSFSCLIFMAIEDSPQKRLPVKEIYAWILNHFPYFQNAPTGWRNSVRHNLSLNKCFRKVDKERGQSIGKGSLWCIDPDYRPNLLQALRKTPYHPYHQMQMLANPQPSPIYNLVGARRPLTLTTQQFNHNTPSPHLFPFLSKRLAQSSSKSFTDVSDIDAASALVQMKGSPNSRPSRNPRLKPLALVNGKRVRRSRSPSPPEFGSAREKRRLKRKMELQLAHVQKRLLTEPIVYTESPSEDHTYSATSPLHLIRSPTSPGSGSSSIDEEYDFGPADGYQSDGVDSFVSEESNFDESECEDDNTLNDSGNFSRFIRKKCSSPAEAAEEDVKLGADALLNLAGINTSNVVPIRAISPSDSNSPVQSDTPSLIKK